MSGERKRRGVAGMKVRLMKPEAFTDPLMCELHPQVRILYMALWCIADDAGVFEDDYRSIRDKAFPGRRNYPVAAWLDVLVAARRIFRCVTPEGMRVFYLPNLERHQIFSPRTRARPRFAEVCDLTRLPAPTLVQRNSLRRRHGVEGWDPVTVPCADCERPGRLYYAGPDPDLGDDDPLWPGAVVASVVEIVPTGSGPDDVELLCRECQLERRLSKLRTARERAAAAPPELSSPDSLPPRGAGAEETGAEEAALVLELDQRRHLAAFRQSATDEPNSVAVFHAWVESTGKRAAVVKFTPARRRLIERALRDYPLEDVLDAVRGWEHIAHNRGENDAGRPYNDLELLLRDAQHIERFRDAARGPRGEVSRGRRAAANVGQFGKTGVGEWA